MKIRTDFVTNSSSSSFVAYRIECKELTDYIENSHAFGSIDSCCSGFDISGGQLTIEMQACETEYDVPCGEVPYCGDSYDYYECYYDEDNEDDDDYDEDEEYYDDYDEDDEENDDEYVESEGCNDDDEEYDDYDEDSEDNEENDDYDEDDDEYEEPEECDDDSNEIEENVKIAPDIAYDINNEYCGNIEEEIEKYLHNTEECSNDFSIIKRILNREDGKINGIPICCQYFRFGMRPGWEDVIDGNYSYDELEDIYNEHIEKNTSPDEIIDVLMKFLKKGENYKKHRKEVEEIINHQKLRISELVDKYDETEEEAIAKELSDLLLHISSYEGTTD